MDFRSIRTLSILAYLFVALLAACSDSSHLESELTADDVEKARLAYENADNEVDKLSIVEEVLKRDTDNKFRFTIVNWVTEDLISRLNNSKAAFEFAEKHLTGLSEDRDLSRANGILLRLAGKSGNREKILEIVGRFGEDLSIETEIDIASAARDAEDWNLMLLHASKADTRTTPESVRELLADEEPEEWFYNAMYKYLKSNALFLKGLGQVKTGDVESGLLSYQAADDVITKNFLGLKYGELSEKWAEALAGKGDWDRVMEVLALDAFISGDKKALESYIKAYLAGGGKEKDLEAHLKNARNEIAQQMPDFKAYAYDGSRISYSELKSEVTLLTFWFPT